MPVQIDMNPDGSFSTPRESGSFGGPPPSGKPPSSSGVLRLAIVVTAIAAAGAVALLALWAALMLIPIALGAGLIAYGVLRYRMWKAGVSFRGQAMGGSIYPRR